MIEFGCSLDVAVSMAIQESDQTPPPWRVHVRWHVCVSVSVYLSVYLSLCLSPHLIPLPGLPPLLPAPPLPPAGCCWALETALVRWRTSPPHPPACPPLATCRMLLGAGDCFGEVAYFTAPPPCLPPP